MNGGISEIAAEMHFDRYRAVIKHLLQGITPQQTLELGRQGGLAP